MKRPDIEAIQNRTNKATKGPWKAELGGVRTEPSDEKGICRTCLTRGKLEREQENAEFIAAARTDIPELLEYVKYLEKLLKEYY